MLSQSPIPPIIFVGGIHGVGKTTFSKELARRSGRLHLSAGALIAEHIKAEKTSDKKVVDVGGNQNALIAAVSNLEPNASIVLDGHFCLIDQLATVQDVPSAVFQALRPEFVIVLRDEPTLIQERLRTRDGKRYELPFISQFQSREIAHGRAISALLGIQCIVCAPNELDTTAQKLPP